MILADKIIAMRKKNGWSQEELAEKMEVSRQAVSKWESAQTVPDLNKILQLGELFGVTTDYLLKDDLELEEFSGVDSALRRVTLQEANKFLAQREEASVRIALATFMCIISPICLFILGVMTEDPYYPLPENIAGAFGMIILLILVAAAVGIYVYTGFQNAPYEFMKEEAFETEYGVRGMVVERQKQYEKKYAKANITGTILCVLSPIALFVGMLSGDELFCVLMLSATMVVAGVGVAFFLVAGVRWASMQILLKEGEYSPESKKKAGIKGMVSGIYWPIIVAIYLAWSFATDGWNTTWIVWPVAGVLFAAVTAVCNLLLKDKE